LHLRAITDPDKGRIRTNIARLPALQARVKRRKNE